MEDIELKISRLNVSEKVKKDAAVIYALIAEAESAAHGVPVNQIHFHEVGETDAIVDIVGVCMLMESLAPDRIIASPVNVGSGMVKCAHGILPVPTPATSNILKDVPMYSGPIGGELCTPTGAAILKHFVSEFGRIPVMSVKKVGNGAGTKDFPAANIVRAIEGEEVSAVLPEGTVYELSCNLDDMSPEAVGFAFDTLMENGALEVYLTPVYMKKNRSAVVLNCLVKQEDADRLAELIFMHTSTRGIRKAPYSRYVMSQEYEKVSTKYGDIRVKISEGFGSKKIKAEYDDVAAAAKAHDVPLSEIYAEVEKNRR